MCRQKVSRGRLLEMARAADALRGALDARSGEAARLRSSEGWVSGPIGFCRFTPTAEYVADELRKDNELPKGTEVAAVTVTVPPEDRGGARRGTWKASRRVLVCTDCRSEGINLQEKFEPPSSITTCHGIQHDTNSVRGVTDTVSQTKRCACAYHGVDNQIDGVVLDVLLKKHKTIRSSLGISVPVPADTEKVMAALLHGARPRVMPVNYHSIAPGWRERR